MQGIIGRFLACMGVSLLSFQLAAQEVDAGSREQIQSRVLDLLSASMPGLSFSDVRMTDLQGYYRVDVQQGPTLYVAVDGSHFFAGDYYRVEADGFANVTEEENAAMRKTRLAEVADEDKIIFAPEGESRAVLTVFTDVTCTFCRRLHSHIEEFLDLGIEVQYLAFPRSGIERSGSYTQEYMLTARAWCADDRRAALTELKEGNAAAGVECSDNPVADEYQLGLEFGVTGTPAIILPDGTLVPGYRTPQEFVEMLDL